jgi:dolichol kinase
MVLLDKKIFSGGIVLLIVGGIILIYLNSMIPVGQAGMTEEEILDLMIKEQENKDLNTLAGILFGTGFLLVLISFGARRRNKGSPKKEEKKPMS